MVSSRRKKNPLQSNSLKEGGGGAMGGGPAGIPYAPVTMAASRSGLINEQASALRRSKGENRTEKRRVPRGRTVAFLS